MKAFFGLSHWTLGGVLVTISLLFFGGCGGGSNNSPNITETKSLTAPENITADAGKNRVTLSWSNVPSATSFNLYYSTSAGVTKHSTKLSDVHSMFIMRDLPNGTPYYFSVAAVGPSGEGSLSAEVSATPSAAPPQPAPTEVRAAAQNGQVSVSWVPGFGASADATTYTVYFSTARHIVKTTSAKVTTSNSPQIVSGLPNGSPYFFVVTATTANGESALSFEVSATPAARPPPVAPSGLKATEGNSSITLKWNPSAGASSYNLYYGTEFDVTKANGIKVTGVSNPFTLQGLTNKAAYFLVVTAVGPGGESFETEQVSATPLANTPIQAMVHIPAGTFQMGDNVLDPTAPAPYATPLHQVSLSAFSIEKYEISYTQWRTVYDWAVTQGYAFDSVGRNGALQLGTNMPVTQINWYDAVKWLNARSEKEGRNPVYFTDSTHAIVYRSGNIDLNNDAVDWLANGYRLPTEAEWEYASRGGLVGKTYPWGDVLDATKANFDRGTSTSIGSYTPNGYGLYDMAGNVWEWTWDHDSTDYSASAAGVINPHGPLTGLLRVRRGGSYVYGVRYLRNFDKMFRSNGYSGPYFGFRAASSQP